MVEQRQGRLERGERLLVAMAMDPHSRVRGSRLDCDTIEGPTPGIDLFGKKRVDGRRGIRNGVGLTW